MGMFTLLLQCVAMAAASLLVGSLPLVLNNRLSSASLEGIQVLGMGLLVGAALAIIIPEGVSTMYAADPHSSHAMGISLLLGFAVMLLVENLSPHPPHSIDPEAIADDECDHDHHPSVRSSRGSMAPMLPKEAEECATHATAHGLSATLGLVIHGLADGIALGASSLSGRAELGLIVFLAVLAHKGPAALGLTTTLLSLHLTPAQVRHRLVIFSLAAPAGAIVTYLLVSLFGGATADPDSVGYWTGAVLLFSGGSFLFVATVIQPISQTGPDGETEVIVLTEDHCHNQHHLSHNSPSLHAGPRTGLILAGMVLPVGLALLVGHHD